MPWVRAYHKEKKVYAPVDEAGRFVLIDGRVPIRFSLADQKSYKVSPKNLVPIDGPAIEAPQPEADPPKKNRKTPPSEPLAKPKRWVTAYTDGACSGNPGPAGAGVLLIHGPNRLERSVFLGIATNNVAELTAIKLALEAIKDKRVGVAIHSDSQYAIGVLSRNWKARKNPELVQEIKDLISAFGSVEIIYIRGHVGVAGNEEADRLARLAIQSRQSTERRWKEAT